MADTNKNLPQSRLMINYETTVDGIEIKKTLPYRVLVTGDFSNGKSIDRREDFSSRSVRRISHGVDRALSSMDINLDFTVPNIISGGTGEDISVNYKLKSMKDFNPGSIVKNIPEIKALLEMKKMLMSFTKEIDNNRNVKKLIEKVFSQKSDLESLRAGIPNLNDYHIDGSVLDQLEETTVEEEKLIVNKDEDKE